MMNDNSEVLHSEFRFGVLRSCVEHQNVEFSLQRSLFCKSENDVFSFREPQHQQRPVPCSLSC